MENKSETAKKLEWFLSKDKEKIVWNDAELSKVMVGGTISNATLSKLNGAVSNLNTGMITGGTTTVKSGLLYGGSGVSLGGAAGTAQGTGRINVSDPWNTGTYAKDQVEELHNSAVAFMVLKQVREFFDVPSHRSLIDFVKQKVWEEPLWKQEYECEPAPTKMEDKHGPYDDSWITDSVTPWKKQAVPHDDTREYGWKKLADMVEKGKFTLDTVRPWTQVMNELQTQVNEERDAGKVVKVVVDKAKPENPLHVAYDKAMKIIS